MGLGCINWDDIFSKTNDGESTNILKTKTLEIISLQVQSQKFCKSIFGYWVSTSLKENFLWKKSVHKMYKSIAVTIGIWIFCLCILVVNMKRNGYTDFLYLHTIQEQLISKQHLFCNHIRKPRMGTTIAEQVAATI